MQTIRGVFARNFVGCCLAMFCAGGALAQQQRIDGRYYGGFGHALATGDGRLAIGSNSNAGYIDIFRREVEGWQFEGRVFSTYDNVFGYRIALGGGWLAIASLSEDGYRNHVNLFRRDGSGAWAFVQRVESPGQVAENYVEQMVVKDNSLVISSQRRDGEGGTLEYRTYVFDYANGTWGPAWRLLPPFTAWRFGSEIALDGDRLAVVDRIVGGGGAVSIFRQYFNGWGHEATLTTPQPNQLLFGDHVALCGGRLAVMAQEFGYQPQPIANQVFIYRFDGSNWVADGAPLLSPVPPAVPYIERFGAELACDGKVLAMRGNADHSAHVLSLDGNREMQTLQVIEPARSAGGVIAVHGSDVMLSDSNRYGLDQPGGVVFAFLNTIDAIFVDTFD